MYDKFRWTSVSKKRNELTQVFEPVQPFFLWKMAESLPDVAFLDIGANIGVYSIFLAARPNISEVFTFEPMSDCVYEIRRNAEMNGFADKIRIMDVALSDKAGTASFRRMSDYSGGNGISDTHLFKDLPYASEDTIRTQSLDELLSMRGKNIVLKIDVEGHEYSVLLGARDLLRTNHGIMQIELHESSPRFKETFDLLNELGWTKVLKVGWDYYFSSLERHQTEAGRMELVEDALAFIVEQSLRSEQPARREILSGVTLELSRGRANGIKRALSYLRKFGRRER
ncbi:FkbM family methyltransferase [Endozoicomonas sp. G2_2]|uniref:FkbM family methyltransferase n=1 Tax=Endozoicomonas sp. G2_2 TaxID=2821092 RepID=UPI001ADCDB6C|nr:FkbM family methyltransferase [Endozoicomonas sp. G2_2]MBO9470147.1 FkbM family methyltransferase [Endozoicomonas sp. G2_2]